MRRPWRSSGAGAVGELGWRVRFRVLGPVTAEISGCPVPIARSRQRAILGYLLLNRNTHVSTDSLVAALWDGERPSTARSQVQTELSILRRLIRSAGAADPITTTPTGYTIRLAGDELDLDDFTARVHDARSATDPSTAAALLRSALDLWTGTPLDGITAAYAASHRVHLDEVRLQAYEHLFDIELRRGRHAEITPELFELAGRYPLRERLTGQLMVALYRDGRQAEALNLVRSLRATLVEQHGLDPGRTLQDLEHAVLRSDPALDLPPAAAGPEPRSATAVPAPMQLPHEPSGFTGRAEQIARLDTILGATSGHPGHTVGILTGTAGVGKTTLAIHWAHRVADRFPDGQLYVNLRGFDARPASLEPAAVLRMFLLALGYPADRIPDDADALSGLYRTRMAGRRMLVLLDNARDAPQVRPLLPGSAGCAVLVTSRNWLAGLVATDGAQVVPVDVFSDGEARELMIRRLGEGRVNAEPGAATEIAVGCARLPLALAIVTANAASKPGIPLDAIAAQLRGAQAGVDAFAIDDDDGNNIAAAFSWSYDTLTADAAALFTALGTHPVPEVSIEAAASLRGIPLARARELAAELTRANLVTERPGARFSMHDLLRAYAKDKGPDGVEPERAMRRVLDHYVHSALRAAILFQPGRSALAIADPDPAVTVAALADRQEALDWLRAEHHTLVTLATEAGAWGFDAHAWRLGWSLMEYLFRVGHWGDWMGVQVAALAAARRLGDKPAMVTLHCGLARALNQVGRYAEAEVELHAALRLSAAIGDHSGEGLAWQILSEIHCLRGSHQRGLDALARALDCYDRVGNALGRAAVLNNLGLRYAALGQYDKALVHGEEALRVFTDRGEVNGIGAVHDTLGSIHHGCGDYASAIDHFRRAAEIKNVLGESYLEAMTLTHLGESCLAVGDQSATLRAWTRAAEILDHLDHPDAAGARTRLDTLGSPRSG